MSIVVADVVVMYVGSCVDDDDVGVAIVVYVAVVVDVAVMVVVADGVYNVVVIVVVDDDIVACDGGFGVGVVVVVHVDDVALGASTVVVDVGGGVVVIDIIIRVSGLVHSIMCRIRVVVGVVVG